MFGKSVVVIAMSCLLFFGITDKALADAASELEQAEAYVKEGNYQQAEQLYQHIVTSYPGTEYAFQAQKGLTILYIVTDQQPQAEAAFQQLANSAVNEDIAAAIKDVQTIIAACRNTRKNVTNITRLWQYVADNWML